MGMDREAALGGELTRQVDGGCRICFSNIRGSPRARRAGRFKPENKRPAGLSANRPAGPSLP